MHIQAARLVYPYVSRAFEEREREAEIGWTYFMFHLKYFLNHRLVHK